MAQIIDEMLGNSHEEPCLIIDFLKLGRGIENNMNSTSPYVTRTKVFLCWKIVNEELSTIDNRTSILFDAENYLFQWTFEFFSPKDELQEETIFYYWRGCQSPKGLSPLPPSYNNENTIIERICQWTEPPVFFHIFPKIVVVFKGKEKNFNPNIPHLFMLRGELQKENHLYEVSFFKKNLRSRAIFFIVLPNEKLIYRWQGAAVLENHCSANIESTLKEIDSNWRNFAIEHVDESCNDIIFPDDKTDYLHIPRKLGFTPRLFYFNSITGDFLATEVLYSLRSTDCIASFPFLQSHLYTADEPALFLLDNHTEIWLWKGQRSITVDNDDSIDYDQLLEFAKTTANEYAKEKERIIGEAVTVLYAEAGLEPIEFTNIFPYWNSPSNQ